jgi:8-oxo-dGTP diphosphatase
MALLYQCTEFAPIEPKDNTMPKPTTPLLAADTIIRMTDDSDSRIVLIERRNEPHGWALPGGFVDEDETVAAAAAREAREETGLKVTLEALLGLYSRPGRDPRGATVSAVFIGHAKGEAKAADDAKDLAFFDPSAPPEPLAFDHATILADYLRYRDHGERPPPDR